MVLATHSIRQFPLHFPSRGPPCTITFQLDVNVIHFCVCLAGMQQKTGVGHSKQAANKENTNQREEAGSIPSNILSIPFKSAVSS